MSDHPNLPIHAKENKAKHLANVAALQRFQVLDSAPEAAFDHIVGIASRIFSVPIVLVSLIDLNRQWFKARIGLEICETSLEVSFCSYAVQGDDVMVVSDATRDERFKENEFVKAPGGIRFYAGAPLRTHDGFVVGTLCLIDTEPRHNFTHEDRSLLSKMASLVIDVMEGRASQKASNDAKKKLEDFTSAALDVFWETDVEHRFTHIVSNQVVGFSRVMEQPKQYLEDRSKIMMGRTRWEIQGASVTEEPWKSHFRTLEDRKPFRELRYSVQVGERTMHLSVSGQPAFDEEGQFLGYRGATHDVTEQEEARREAERLANSDPLTGLANRRRWNSVLKDQLRANPLLPFSILLFDVDRFKDINDALGHSVGDQLLVEIAKRISYCAGTGWLAARLGGDEFALLVRSNEENAVAAADRIVKAMNVPFQLNEQNLHVELSIGVRTIDRENCDYQRAMVDADLALRRAKELGRHRHVVFDPSMRKENDTRLALTSQFERALKNQEFLPYYQPQMRLSNGTVVGMEALLRWKHPVRGLLLPAQFLDALETSVFDIPVGRFVIDRACKQAKEWLDMNAPVRVGINVSASQLYGDDLPKVLSEAMSRHGTPPALIEVEVTERVALGNTEKIQTVLEAIRALGVTVAFDDFGTGFASLCSLMQFPLDRVKIDQTFVSDLHVNRANAGLTSGLVRLCHSLGFEVTAEGVENSAHEEFLRQQNCDEVQGYHFSRPLDSSEATKFLLDNRLPFNHGERVSRKA